MAAKKTCSNTPQPARNILPTHLPPQGHRHRHHGQRAQLHARQPRLPALPPHQQGKGLPRRRQDQGRVLSRDRAAAQRRVSPLPPSSSPLTKTDTSPEPEPPASSSSTTPSAASPRTPETADPSGPSAALSSACTSTSPTRPPSAAWRTTSRTRPRRCCRSGSRSSMYVPDPSFSPSEWC